MTANTIKGKLRDAADPCTWGMAWGAVEPPEGSEEQAPFDAAFLAPFGRRPILTSGELFKLVQDKFAERCEGVTTPIDVARVDEWKKNAVARGLVEEDSNNSLQLTNRGEEQLRALQSGGLTRVARVPGMATTVSHVWAAVGGAGAVSAILHAWVAFIIVVVSGIIFSFILYRIAGRGLEPIVQRRREIEALTDEETRNALAAVNHLTVDDLPPHP